jgi:hypothetical protein
MFSQVFKCSHVGVEVIPLHSDIDQVKGGLLTVSCVCEGGDEFIFKGLPNGFIGRNHRAIIYGRLEGVCLVLDPIVDLWPLHIG